MTRVKERRTAIENETSWQSVFHTIIILLAAVV
jgi:hypothetical protein